MHQKGLSLPVPGGAARELGRGFVQGPGRTGQGVRALDWKRGDVDEMEGRNSFR